MALILAVILICGISATSANEINSANVGNIVSSDNVETSDVLKNTGGNDISSSDDVNVGNNLKNSESSDNIKTSDVSQEIKDASDSNNNELGNSQSEQNVAVTNNNQVNSVDKRSYLTVGSTSVVRGKTLNIYLKNSLGKGISGQKVTITFANKKFTKTTNANGLCTLKLSSKVGKYSVKVKYAGSTAYLSSSNSFKIKIYKIKTVINVLSKSVVRGKYMYVSLKGSNGKPISSKLLKITFNKKTYKKYTNKNGLATLKISSKPGTYQVKVKYAGSISYTASSKSFKLKSYLHKTKIVVTNSKVVKGKYLYAYLKDSSNNPISNKKMVITFNNKKYSRTTNANGRVSLKINVKANSKYKTTIKFAGSTSYATSSKSLKVSVVKKVNAKIIAVSSTSSGNYSIRLVDNNGVPISGKTLTLKVYTGESAGSGISINKKTIILNSDKIYNTEKDTALLNDIATILRSKGYNVIVNTNINPNAHCSDIMGKYSDACVFCIFGGVDSGMFVDMGSTWYQNYLKKYNNQVVLGFTKTSRNLATEDWLERAHDDNYSPSSFTGLANPGAYLNSKGFDYVYGDTAAQLAENFLNYAVNGLSIGKDNILPGTSQTFKVTTNDDGYATISGLSAGAYKIVSSCSGTDYTADSVISYLTVA